MKQKPWILYGLYNPHNRLCAVCKTAQDCWMEAFQFQDVFFKQKYWKRYDAGVAAYKRLGWIVFKGYFQSGRKS